MQYLPGFTVQCINPHCEREPLAPRDATRAFSDEGRCPCCGDFPGNVPPCLGPRFPCAASADGRTPLRPRPRDPDKRCVK